MMDKTMLVRVYRLLPLTDCGDCGEKSCRNFSEKIILGELKATDCPHISDEVRQSIALVLDEYYR